MCGEMRSRLTHTPWDTLRRKPPPGFDLLYSLELSAIVTSIAYSIMLEYRMQVDCGSHPEYSDWYTEDKFAEFSMNVVRFQINHPGQRIWIEQRTYQPEEPRKKLIDF